MFFFCIAFCIVHFVVIDGALFSDVSCSLGYSVEFAIWRRHLASPPAAFHVGREGEADSFHCLRRSRFGEVCMVNVARQQWSCAITNPLSVLCRSSGNGRLLIPILYGLAKEDVVEYLPMLISLDRKASEVC